MTNNCDRDRKRKLTPYFVFILLLVTVGIASALVNTNIVSPADFDGSVLVNVTNLPLEENGGLAVNIQDQTTAPFDIRANQIINSDYALTVVPVINTYDLILNTTTGLVIGDDIAFLEQNGIPQLLFGEILNIVGNTITIDTLIPYNFTPSDTTIFEFDNQITSDGSITPQIYGITNFFDQSIDITRFIWHCTDSTAMDDSKFCGGNSLTRGLLLRKNLNNGNYINYFNVKTNGEWSELAFDKSYDDKAPAGSFGFTTRLTYGGQSKHGVVIRLEPGQSVELVNQDDLTILDTGSLMIEGHFTQN